MDTVSITINGKKYAVQKDSTILAASKENQIEIPTLCYFEKLEPRANCRMCVVEVEGMRTLQPACATRVREGMVIHTHSPKVMESRKLTLELMLSRHAVDCHHCLRLGNSHTDDLDPKFCEMCFFCDCVRDGFCELQALAREYKVDQLPFDIEDHLHDTDNSLDTVIRNPNKCIKCRRCVDVCGQVQSVHNLCVQNRGCEVKISVANGKTMAESQCIQCGKCVEVCPTGALYMQEHKDQAVYYAHQYDYATAMQVSEEAVRKLESIMKKKPGSISLHMMAGSFKKIGIDVVMSSAYADAVSKQQAEKLLDEKLGKAMVILTNSYAAKNYLEQFYSDLQDKFAFYDSSQEIFDKYMKESYAEASGIEPAQMKTMNFTDNNESAGEAKAESNVDIVVNAREVYRMFQRTGAEPNKKRKAKLHDGPAVAISTKYGSLLEKVSWNMEKEPKELELTIDDQSVSAVICSNLNQAHEVLEQVKSGMVTYDIIRIVG